MKKVLLAVVAFFTKWGEKAIAAPMQIAYGPPTQELYGNPPPMLLEVSFSILKFLAIPIFIIIGIVIYIKRKRKSKKDIEND